MNIAIGSTNKIKVQALEEVLQAYPSLAQAKIFPFAVSSEVSHQPLSLDEIIKGSKNRAKNAFEACQHCHYAFGIESGLFEAIGSTTGYLEAAVCAIYDGKQFSIGLSPGFEIPSTILNLVLNQKVELNDACHMAGFTSNKSLGSAEGLIGMLTKGRINRKEYTKQALITALIQYENTKWYYG